MASYDWLDQLTPELLFKLQAEVNQLTPELLFELQAQVNRRAHRAQLVKSVVSAASYTDSFAPVRPSFDNDRSTVSSATLYSSGRSTPNESSVGSDSGTIADASSLYEHDPPLHQGTGNAFWPTLPAYHKRNTGHSCLREETLRKTHGESSLSTTVPNTMQPYPSGHPKAHFCVYCFENSKEKRFTNKQDWKRHQEDYHIWSGLVFTCQYKGCDKVFYEGLKFKIHIKKDHNGQVLPRDCKEVRQQPRVYACGFQNCRALEVDWKDYCDHLSTHMKKWESEWSYNKSIRNLLKHHAISLTWKEVYTQLGPKISIMPSQLTWDPRLTREMKHKLEYHQFGPNVKEFLHEVFWAGVPQAACPSEVPLQPLGFYPPPPPAATSAIFSTVSSSFGEPWTQPTFGSFGQNFASSEAVDQMQAGMLPSSSTYRNSYVMTDAPSMSDTGALESPLGEEGDAPFELLSAAEFLEYPPPNDCFSNSSVPPTAHGMSSTADSKKSPKLLTRFFNGRKSQHFQQGSSMNHPDLPRDARMPIAPPKRSSPQSPAATGAEKSTV